MHFPAGIWALFVRFRTFFGRPRYRRRIRLVALYRMDRFSAPYVNSEAQNFDCSVANYLLRTINGLSFHLTALSEKKILNPLNVLETVH